MRMKKRQAHKREQEGKKEKVEWRWDEGKHNNLLETRRWMDDRTQSLVKENRCALMQCVFDVLDGFHSLGLLGGLCDGHWSGIPALEGLDGGWIVAQMRIEAHKQVRCARTVVARLWQPLGWLVGWLVGFVYSFHSIL